MSRRKQIWFQLGYLALVALIAAQLMLWLVLDADKPIEQVSIFPTALMFAAFIPMRVLRVWQLVRPQDPALRDGAATVTLRQSFAEKICSIVMGLGFLAMGGLPLIGFHRPDVPGFALVIIVAVGLFTIGHALSSPRAHLTLSPDGLDWSRITPEFMPWHDIRTTEVRRLLFTAIVEFEVRETGKYFVKSFRKRPSQRFGIFPLLFSADAETLAEAIKVRCAHSDPQSLSTGAS